MIDHTETSRAGALVVSLELPDNISRAYLEHFRILPMSVAGGRLRLAAAGEPDSQALDDLSLLFNARPDVVAVEEDVLLLAISRAADDAASSLELLDGNDALQTSEPALQQLADARNLATQPPVIRCVNALIRYARAAGASDVHVEATAEGPRVRIRVDGALLDTDAVPRSIADAVVSRIKLLADLDIAQRRIPQDGRIRARVDDSELDLRVSTLPSLHGESVVLRLLDRAGQLAGLDDLGMPPDMRATFRDLCALPHGIVLVTGPTGSGKTTTLHAALRLRDAKREKIITVEDPVEYRLPGITQVPVLPKAGVTFASALRSAVRQDPDVMMVGEMRDDETATIAVRAALTGHLVFSTLHTNDAISAIPRLTDLGVEPYLVASTVQAILAQRLVRRVCPGCTTHCEPDPAVVASLGGYTTGSHRLVHGTGCDRCHHSGYSGRTGIFELLVPDDSLRDLIATRGRREELRESVRARGMRSLRMDGWTKVQDGLTTLPEILRVTEGGP